MMESSVPSAASPVARVAAFIAGLFLAVCGLLASVGTVLFSFAAMGIASSMKGRQGRVLGPLGKWIASTCGAALVMLLALGATWVLTPRSTWSQMKHVMDSTSTNTPQAPPPAWLEKIAPGTAQRAAQQNAKPSEALQTGVMMWGVGFMVMFFSGIIGSLGWGAGMLLGFAAKGRWPGTDPAPPVEFAPAA